MKKILLLFAALMLITGASSAQKAPAPVLIGPAPGAKTWSVKAEGSAPLKGSSKEEARQAALREAEKNAVLAYVSLKTPPAIVTEHQADLDALTDRPGQWVSSWEVRSEGPEAGDWKIEIEAELDLTRLNPALKAAQLLPSRPMPLVFLAAAGKIGDNDMKSGWDKAAEARGQFNVCESAVAGRLEKYGFIVITPDAGRSAGDVSRIINPGGDEEKKQLYSELRDKFGAGAMVVGLADAGTESPAAPGSDTVSTRVSLKIAAADLEKGDLVYTDEVSTVFQEKGIPFREDQMNDVCGKAGQKVVAALFSAFTPRFQPGEAHPVSLTVRGIGSFPAMHDLQQKLKTEGPGVTAVELSRMGTGEIEFSVTTTAGADALARWLTDNQFQAGRLEIIWSNDESISAKVKGTP